MLHPATKRLWMGNACCGPDETIIDRICVKRRHNTKIIVESLLCGLKCCELVDYGLKMVLFGLEMHTQSDLQLSNKDTLLQPRRPIACEFTCCVTESEPGDWPESSK